MKTVKVNMKVKAFAMMVALVISIVTMATLITPSIASAETGVHPVTDYDINQDGTVNILDLCRLKKAILEDNGNFSVEDLVRITKVLFGIEVEEPIEEVKGFSSDEFEKFNEDDILKMKDLLSEFTVVNEENGKVFFNCHVDDGLIKFTANAQQNYKGSDPINIIGVYEKAYWVYIFIRESSGNLVCFYTNKNALMAHLGCDYTIDCRIFSCDNGEDMHNLFKPMKDAYANVEQVIDGKYVTIVVEDSTSTKKYIFEVLDKKPENSGGTIVSIRNTINTSSSTEFVLFCYEGRVYAIERKKLF